MGGVFHLVDSQGLPLEIVLDIFQQREIICDWLDFWDAALKQGWRQDRTLRRITSAISDVYGPDYRVEWERRFSHVLKAREEPDSSSTRQRDEEHPGGPPDAPGHQQKHEKASE